MCMRALAPLALSQQGLSAPLGNDVLARDPGPLHLCDNCGHIPLQSPQRIDGAPEPSLDAMLPLEARHRHGGVGSRSGGLVGDALLDEGVVVGGGVAEAGGVGGGSGAGDGALEGGHLLEQLFLCGDEVCGAAAFARVIGLVDGRRRGGGGGRGRGADLVLGDVEAVDGEVRGGEGKGPVNELQMYCPRVSQLQQVRPLPRVQVAMLLTLSTRAAI